MHRAIVLIIPKQKTLKQSGTKLLVTRDPNLGVV
jgi:hypothetical protein